MRWIVRTKDDTVKLTRLRFMTIPSPLIQASLGALSLICQLETSQANVIPPLSSQAFAG